MLILREKREVGEDEVERGPPVSGGGGSERGRARSGRPVREVSGAGLGPNGQLGRSGAPGPNPVSVQAACVFFLNTRLKWPITNSNELLKTPK